MEPEQHDIKNRISGDICSRCGGEAPGWKCSKCGYASSHFDPLHWRQCAYGGKVQAQCKKCGEAEDNCKCETQ